jgi:hypothetical protein
MPISLDELFDQPKGQYGGAGVLSLDDLFGPSQSPQVSSPTGPMPFGMDEQQWGDYSQKWQDAGFGVPEIVTQEPVGDSWADVGFDPMKQMVAAQNSPEWELATPEERQTLLDSLAQANAENKRLEYDQLKAGMEQDADYRAASSIEMGGDGVPFIDKTRYQDLVPGMKERANRLINEHVAGRDFRAEGFGKDLDETGERDTWAGRTALQTASGIGATLKSAFNRLTGDPDEARQTELDMGQIEQAVDERQANELQRAATGAASTIGKAGFAGAAGGPAAVIGTFVYDSASRAHAETGDLSYALTVGTIEGVITAAFQLAGLGGFEKGFKGVRGAGLDGVKKFTKQLAGELTEEEIIGLGQAISSQLEGIDPDALKKFPQQAKKIAFQTILTLGAMKGAVGVADFLDRPNKKTAEAAGIPPELSRTQRKRVELAEAVKAQLSNLNSSQSQTGQDGQEVSTILDTEPEAQAPTSPVDASVAETTTEPDQALPTQPEPSGEAVGGEQAFTEPGRSRSLPEAVDALFKAQLRARGLSDAEISQLSPDDPLVQELIAQEPEAIRARMVPPVESTPPPKKRLGRKVHPPVATENVKQVLQNAPESKMDRLKREKREQENARNIRTGNGESPSQAKGWLRDAISRRPQGVNTPPEIATWLANGFSNSHYWKLLKKDGVTLEEAVAREMQPDIQNPVSEPAPNVPKAGQPQEDISSPSVAPPDAPSAVPPPSPQRDSGVAIAPTATARVSLDAIPSDIEVDVQAIKSKSGERVSVKQNAREAVAELDESIELYRKLWACITRGK